MQSKKIHFSIVTPTYNRAASGYLKENIECIQNQKVGDFTYEHVIMDDGSTDNTQQLVGDFIKKDKRIKYYHQNNTGVAKAIQNALEKIDGNFVILMGDDDLLQKDSLYQRAEFIKSNPDIDWFYGQAEWIDDFGLPIPVGYQSNPNLEHLYERQLITNTIHGGTPTMSKKAIDTISWPKWLVRSEDYFMWLELLRPEKNLKVGYLNKPVFIYRLHKQGYTLQIDDPQKKQKKAELNARIKDLHPDSLSFLAQEALYWREEAHRTNKYWEERYKFLKNDYNFLKKLDETYRSSRVIGKIIRAGNLFRRIKRKLSKIFNKFVIMAKSIARIGVLVRPNNRELSVTNVAWPKSQPLVSVISPYFNQADTISQTAHSVLSQTYQNLEYIIVDDASTDKKSQEYLEKINHLKIAIIHQPQNKGVADTRNTGIKNAKGKYILCLDSDDYLDPTYIEKAVAILEGNPIFSVVTFDTKMFGAREEKFIYPEFEPLQMTRKNMIITAAVFLREAWEKTGGYKNNIGYEDWEFWVNLTKHGYFAKHVPEALFNYRTAEDSRFIQDSLDHEDNSNRIKHLHKDFARKTRKHLIKQQLRDIRIELGSAFINLGSSKNYLQTENNKPNVLIAIPWMTFGGAETLILNYTKVVKDKFNLSFVTGLNDKHEWEDKFKSVTSNIYHLANLFDSQEMYLEFISNYIETRNIELLHIIHCGYVFELLAELKKRHPKLKVAVTLFNDFAPYFKQSIEYDQYIDTISTDNQKVEMGLKKNLPARKNVPVIPNGIDIEGVFNPEKYSREDERNNLGISKEELSVFFVGRLSEEKNPDVFLETAKKIQDEANTKIKFFMIGSGPMRQEVIQTIESQIIKNVEYLGYRSDIARYLAAADVFVLPSSVEGFPLSILEAMAMNTAVVASDVGAVADIIDEDETGNIVSPGSADEIAESIMSLYRDRKKLERLKSNARKVVIKKYSSKLLGERYQQLYEGLLK